MNKNDLCNDCQRLEKKLEKFTTCQIELDRYCDIMSEYQQQVWFDSQMEWIKRRQTHHC
mgnify:CR=1 FL=1